jgi:hypothetical protein
MKTKSTFIALLLSISSLSLIAQDVTDDNMQTLFGDGPVTIGGYGGPRLAYSQFDGKDTWLMGGRGGAIFNKTFVFGGAGYGIVNSPVFSNHTIGDSTYNEVYLEGGYGGMLFEYIIKPNKVVHISIPLLVGAGGMLYTDKRFSSSQGEDMDNHILSNSTFFVIEPGVEIELNVIKFMRIAAGINYRYASGLDLPSTPKGAFNTLSGSISFKFGSF